VERSEAIASVVSSMESGSFGWIARL
jgi:hypothetical protein